MSAVFKEYTKSLPTNKTVQVRMLCPNCFTHIPTKDFAVQVNGFNAWHYREYEHNDSKFEFGCGEHCTNECFRNKTPEQRLAIKTKCEAPRLVKCQRLFDMHCLETAPLYVDDSEPLDLSY